MKLAWRIYLYFASWVRKFPGLKGLLLRVPVVRQIALLPRRSLLRLSSGQIVSGEGYSFKLSIPAKSYGFTGESVNGTYESETVRTFRELLAPGMTVVDVGAHVGYLSLISARCVGANGHVYSFEPQPEVYALLCKNIADNGQLGNVEPINKAVSDHEGSHLMFEGDVESGGASLYATKGTGTTSIAVEMTTLDSTFAGRGWPRIDLVKIDIEGAEKAALDGMRDLVARNPDIKLIVEFHPENQLAAGVAPSVLFETLESLGLGDIHPIDDNALSAPVDVEQLTERYTGSYVNLLCQRPQAQTVGN